jgi:hypothetical protein
MSDSIELREQLRNTLKILEELECDEDQNKILCLPYYKYMLELSIQIYKMDNLTVDGKLECQWGLSMLKPCRDNIIRVLDCIKKINKHGQEKDQVTYDEDLVAIIRDAIKTCCYYKSNEEIPFEGFRELVLLKEDNPYLFQECVDEILKTKVIPGRYDNPTFKFVLHPGFQERILGVRPGHSPKSNDKKGLLLCKLRFFIRNFLFYYRIEFTQNERFAKFRRDCIKAMDDSKYKYDEDLVELPDGGRSSRRRKAYKTTRRNNKNKNKKQYRRKRHTKRCKKSHRRSRR